MRTSDLLGLNSRNHLYTSVYNSRRGKQVANSKLKTKEVLRAHDIRVPRSYKVIRSQDDIDNFDPATLPPDFVMKPNNGLGGQGILVIERRGERVGEWISSHGDKYNEEDLKLHLADILAGQYSMDYLSDIAYIEERVRVHPVFAKYSYHGTPDIRVIVFNNVPVMSYVRLPTEESGGRANLFQGAAAVGIDMATGITTYGIHHAKATEFFPGTRRKMRGIQIPMWDAILETAILAAQAVGLGYMASDIVLQPMKKEGKGKQALSSEPDAVPMILELNAQPGLKIQIANRAGLRDRLSRVKGLKIKDAKHGIRVARALFADSKLMEKGLGRKSVGAYEEVDVIGTNGQVVQVVAKIDTGADSSSIDRELARQLGLLHQDNFLYDDYFMNANGRIRRQVVGAKFVMQGRKIKSRFSVADRSRLKTKILIGRRDLKDFVVVVA